jgi:DNA-binding ferritin-like protein
MGEELQVLATKSTKYLHDAIIVARMAHWNCRGEQFFSAHLMFSRIYDDLSGIMDSHVELLRATGFNPDFQMFSGPEISMDRYDANTLVELVLDYVMAANSAIGMFFRFSVDKDHDPRMVALSDHLGGASNTILGDTYLLQAWLGH